MGRIKSRFIKSSGKKIYTKGESEFGEDFSQNKTIVEKYAVIPSKKLKNAVVGYITRLKKNSDKE